MMNRNFVKVLSGSLLAGLLLVNCGGSDQPNIEPIRGMMETVDYKAQDYNPRTKDGSSMMVPPEGTLPRGKKRYPFGPGDADEAERKLKNPFAGQTTPEFMARGKNRYEIYCGLCHGMDARGLTDGPIASKMIVKPPTLVSGAAANFKDGRLYHIIMRGKGVMGSYANQVHTEKDRWAIVEYIKSLR